MREHCPFVQISINEICDLTEFDLSCWVLCRSHHRSWQDSQPPIKRNVWPILKFLQGKSQHVALATSVGLWGVLLGSFFGLTCFRPDVIQSPSILCWTPRGSRGDRNDSPWLHLPPIPCYLRVLGDEAREGEKRRMRKGGYRRTTGGPAHPDMEAWLLKAWDVSSLANYILGPTVTVLWTLSLCLPLHWPF